MRALVYETFGGPLQVRELADPRPADHGAVLRVLASGLCRSDWHAWQGHDPDVVPPMVPGHELVGVVEAVGPQVQGWSAGALVTVPFVGACGTCPACRAGDQQVCSRQTQPGFTHHGSFAELVAVDHADVNLVALPEGLDPVPAAALGCRVATAWRAILLRGRLRAGEQVAVHGCGGLGLAAVMIAALGGGRVVAVDVRPPALQLARELGAHAVLDARGLSPEQVAGAVADLTGGGAQLSVDAVGSPATCAASVVGLRRRGRHVQAGLLPGGSAVPMDRVVAFELDVLGSHGLAAHEYPALLDAVVSGALPVHRLVAGTTDLPGAAAALARMGDQPPLGVLVVDRF